MNTTTADRAENERRAAAERQRAEAAADEPVPAPKPIVLNTAQLQAAVLELATLCAILADQVPNAHLIAGRLQQLRGTLG